MYALSEPLTGLTPLEVMFRRIIQFILKQKSKRILRRFNPLVVGVTGSVGKSSTKEAVALALSSCFNVRKSPINYNNEIGLPLTILDEKSGEGSLLQWLKLFWRTERKFRQLKEYPDILVLEMAADHPGDIDYLLSIVQPKIGVLTAIGPCHLKYFKNIENVKREKIKLLTNVNKNGWAIFNQDDPNLSDIKSRLKANVLTYGFGSSADIFPLEIQLSQELRGKQVHIFGLYFKVRCLGSIIPVFLPKILSRSVISAVLAAIAVGVSQKINLLKISEKMRQYKPLPGRMNLIKGSRKTLIIDDSYNSSPRSVKSALFDLSQIKNHPQTKKWVVLGDMLELGRDEKKYHLEIGKEIGRRKSCVLIGIGKLARFIVKGAIDVGMSKNRALYFKEKKDALRHLRENIGEGDVVLIKGSRAMKMEELVKGLKSSLSF